MTEPPRRMPPTQGEAVRVLDRVARAGRGNSWSRRVAGRVFLAGLEWAGIFAIVEHGDDPNVLRPPVLLCYWVGAAVPVNALDYDLRYPATL